MLPKAKVQETIVKLVPGGEHNLAHLSDAELLASTRRVVGTSNKLFAALLLHLAEVEARGIHRTRACASLYTYCIYDASHVGRCGRTPLERSTSSEGLPAPARRNRRG